MKKIISVFFVAFIVSLYIGCSSETIISDETNLDLSTKFFLYEKEYQSEKLKGNLYDELWHTSNYENSIFKFITNDKSFDNTDASIYSANIGYKKHTDFDRAFFKKVLSEFISLDASYFFSKVSYYEDFIKNEVKDDSHRNYLLSNLEELKWTKYSIYYVQKNSSNIAKSNNGDACFDGCMEESIEDHFDWWGGWVQFIASPGPTIAWLAGECIYNCYF